MIALREAFTRDRDAILALRRRAFPHDDLEKQEPAFWDWEFAGGRMFVAEDDGRVVGHFGFVPQRWRIGGREVPALLAVDAMIDPERHRQGVFTKLAQFAIEMVRNDVPLVTAFQIRKAVLPGMLRAGWQEAAVAPVLLRPALASLPLPVRARSATAELVHDEHRFAGGWTYTTRRDGDAWLISRDSTLKGIRTHALVDFGGDAIALRRLILDAVHDARRRGLPLAAALITRDHPHFATLARCGFMRGPHRFRLLAQSFDAGIDVRQRWAITWAATDHV